MFMGDSRYETFPLAVARFAIPDTGTLPLCERYYYDKKASLIPLKKGNAAELRRFIEEYNRLVREFCSEGGALYLPVAEELTGGIETFTDVCHLRLPGIKRKAQIMFMYLKDHISVRLEKEYGQTLLDYQ